MPCYKPLEGYAKIGGGITFNKKASNGSPMKVPCGQCIGCRLDYSRDWAVRCMHEAKMHTENCFITLTYSPEHLPANGTLVKEHFQKFIRSLRKRTGKKIRYFHCGEYGEKTSRPHYHAILFGFDFPDKKLFCIRGKNKVYLSKLLNDTWGYGLTEIGSATWESAAYVARYMLKKHKGASADEHYSRIDKSSGEVIRIQEEYTTMSTSPGIGFSWYLRFSSDIWNSGKIVIMKPNGKTFECRVPRYYEKCLQKYNPDALQEFKNKKLEFAKSRRHESTAERLEAREIVATEKVKKLVRNYEKII